MSYPHTAEEIDADWEAGQKAYRALRNGERRLYQIRQAERKFIVREIEGASLELKDGEYFIAGLPWFIAWLTRAVFHALGGEAEKILPPKDWLAEQKRTTVERELGL